MKTITSDKADALYNQASPEVKLRTLGLPVTVDNLNAMKTQTYIDLKVGDIRQLGDEVRHRTGGTESYFGKVHKNDFKGLWRPVSLLDYPILPADLIATELRRPV